MRGLCVCVEQSVEGFGDADDAVLRHAPSVLQLDEVRVQGQDKTQVAGLLLPRQTLAQSLVNQLVLLCVYLVHQLHKQTTNQVHLGISTTT